MTAFTHERYCSEIVAQTALVREALRGADLSAAVPTCPEWTLAELLNHIGQAHRGAEEIVRTRAAEYDIAKIRESVEMPEGDDLAAYDAWLAEGAETLARTLREAGPDTPVWTFAGPGDAAFWARRMAHETVIHRADVALATGAAFGIDDPALAVDCFDEWLAIVSSPVALAFKPQLKEVLGQGHTIHVHATDAAPELEAEWVIDLTGETIAWRRAHEKSSVAVRGPLTDVLLVLYRRRSPSGEGIEVTGDRAVLEGWLERASF
ncbi:maleylpyruvate isomerase N-terminal domain-containing protein [Streptomyces gamaensis]|uniref:Maleylpyruvate isomerase N-terminal domain-containing protein n=1 Tax=Streptomyces gamaensis TaxID=1763542 RepID=A0ABW0YXN0_9ACTN